MSTNPNQQKMSINDKDSKNPKEEKRDFIAQIEKGLATSLKDGGCIVVLDEEKPTDTDESKKKEKEIASPDNNSVEIVKTRELERLDLDFQQLISLSDLNAMSLLQCSLVILRKKFFSFLTTNLVITIGFFAISFLLLLQFGIDSKHIYCKLLKHLSRNVFTSINLILSIIVTLFWVMFSWLRGSYLAIISNYFDIEEGKKPLTFGFKKTLSFAAIELMQLITLAVGSIFIFLLPVFAARYFLSMPILIDKDKSPLDAMLMSAKYCKGKFLTMARLSLFITLFTIAVVASCAAITNLFIESRLIFYTTNFLLFSFIFLPLNGAYRFLLYKKLESVENEFDFQFENSQKLRFLLIRFFFFLFVIINIYLASTGAFDEIAALLQKQIHF